MFLWVALVLQSLSAVDSIAELQKAIETMPRELPLLYGRILDQICYNRDDSQRAKVLRMLSWLLFSNRPLKSHELLHGVAVTTENPVLNLGTILHDRAISICKPLVERLPNGNIMFVHFTVSECVPLIKAMPHNY